MERGIYLPNQKYCMTYCFQEHQICSQLQSFLTLVWNKCVGVVNTGQYITNHSLWTSFKVLPLVNTSCCFAAPLCLFSHSLKVYSAWDWSIGYWWVISAEECIKYWCTGTYWSRPWQCISRYTNTGATNCHTWLEGRGVQMQQQLTQLTEPQNSTFWSIGVISPQQFIYIFQMWLFLDFPKALTLISLWCLSVCLSPHFL